MSMSGMDYFGADIGGFHRGGGGDLNNTYTEWFANGMMFDVPGRPHTEPHAVSVMKRCQSRSKSVTLASDRST